MTLLLEACRGAIEGSPSSREWDAVGDLGGDLRVEVGEGWVDDPRVGLGEKDGQSAPLAGELVALGAGDPLDESFACEAA